MDEDDLMRDAERELSAARRHVRSLCGLVVESPLDDHMVWVSLADDLREALRALDEAEGWYDTAVEMIEGPPERRGA